MPALVTLNQQRLTHATTVAQEAVRSGGYASLVLAVANRSDLLWQQVVPGTDPVQWDSIFSIASISKPVTITALMQLVERGRLVLRDPVVEYIPEFGQQVQAFIPAKTVAPANVGYTSKPACTTALRVARWNAGAVECFIQGRTRPLLTSEVDGKRAQCVTLGT
jgi:hypothetical protein